MALSKKEKLKLLKRSSQDRAKKHASFGENFSYFNQDKLKELGLSIVRPKAREESYFFNVIPFIDNNDEDTYVLVTKTHSVEVNGSHRNVICPKAMYNLPCPVCEKRMDKMANDPDDDGAINKLKVKEREVYYIEDASNESEKKKGIQLFEVAATFFGWKVKPLTKPKVGGVGVKGNKGYTDISDFENGKMVAFNVGTKTIEINKKPVKIPDYTGHNLVDRDPISDSIIEKAVELPPLEDLITVMSYDELYEMINNEAPEKDEGQSSKSEKDESGDEGSEKKSELKKRLDKIKKAKEKKVDLDFDYMEADAEGLEEYIEDNNVPIDEDLIGNEKKMRITVKRFIKNIKKNEKSKSWPDKDAIDDLNDFMDELELKELLDFCEFHKIEVDDDDKDDEDEVKDAIEDWYIS